MIKFKEEKGLTFDDVILVPRKSSFGSRFNGEVDLSVEIVPNVKLKYPIISANMDTVTGARMANAMSALGGLGIIHRFLGPEDHKEQLEKTFNDYTIMCVGVGDAKDDLLCNYAHQFDGVLIDIAHGHSDLMVEKIHKIKEIVPNLPIIAGNVATGEGAAELASAGANCIKVGVGPGCFAAGTRVLMANGFYKNIENIKSGDRVINMNGEPVRVLRSFTTGFRKVMLVRHSNNAYGTVCTDDHRYLSGDLNSVSQDTLSSKGYAKILSSQSKTVPKQSKVKWKEIGDFKQDVALLPRHIKFELRDYFRVELKHRFGEDVILTPSYDVGYLFGFFLGDGNSSCTVNSKTGSKSGHVTFYPATCQYNMLEKLNSISKSIFGKELNTKAVGNVYNAKLYYKPLADFLDAWGKGNEKHLPEDMLVNDPDYLRGLYEGLFDSDGIRSDRNGFSNTSIRLVELFNILHYLLFGYFPTFEQKKASVGGLDCNEENCNDAFLSRINLTAEKRLIEQHQILKILETKDLCVEVPVYDITVDCSTHSFIADNAIVHNSLCTTRVKTGCGVPQISAIVEVEEAVRGVATVIADGGIRHSGDMVKALAAGANAVMVGRLFAGTYEAPGEIINIPGQGKMKVYRGMASKEAQESWKGKATSIEGEMTLVPYQGMVSDIFNDLISGMKSGMSYQNARNLTELRENAVFFKQTAAGIVEAKPHALFK